MPQRYIQSGEFDRHYDLIGFYKSLTQVYGTAKEQVNWRRLLHNHFKKMFITFPSLSGNYVFHPNPCLGAVVEPNQIQKANVYGIRPNAERAIPYRRPEDCSPIWSNVDGWRDFPDKPNHADVAKSIVAGLVPDTPESPRHNTSGGATDVKDLLQTIHEQDQIVEQIETEQEFIRDDGERLQNLAEWVADQSNKTNPLFNLATQFIRVADDDDAADAANALVLLQEKPVDVAKFLDEIKPVAVVKLMTSSHALAQARNRALAPARAFLDALYLSVEV